MAINISDNSPRVSYTVAQGVTQSSFTVNFAFFEKADLNVYVDGVLKTIETDYTVTGGDGSTGSVSISVTGASGGSSVVITRDVEIERTTDFPSSGPFQIEALNTELDRITAIMADVQDQASRTMQLTDYDVSNNLTLPEVDGRKGRVLAFDEQTGAASVGPTISDTQSIADVSADIARLADIEDGTIATDAIQTAATNATAISTVSGSIANVNTVSTNIADVNSVATNMAEVLTADTNAATATTKAAEASASATAAAASETAAATSETNAATSETNAATSATSAASSASASASSASASASSATAAQTAETNAETAETNAATSATNAATSATNAATSATNASTSATNAATSATAASTAQTAAEAARDSALSAFDSFDDRYLGTKTSDPSVDNDGNALVAGALYFNTTASAMKVYTGSTWVAAYVSGTDYLALSGGEMTGDIKYGDNVKAKFGASDDLQIYHDGSNSFINDTGTGNLLFDAAQHMFETSGTERMRIDSSGKVGIGTSSPQEELDIYASVPTIRFSDTDGSYSRVAHNAATLLLQADEGGVGTGYMQLDVGGSERMRIDSSGRVGIGTSPASGVNLHLHEAGSGQMLMAFTNDTTGSGANDGLHVGLDSGENAFVYNKQNTALYFGTNNTERMRIDSNGYLLVGKTADNLTDAGQVFTTVGSSFTRSGGAACQFNRNTSDGEVIRLSKDGTTVGSIGTKSFDLYIGKAESGLLFDVTGADGIRPFNTTAQGESDANLDLGSSSARFKDLYLSGGIRNPSGDLHFYTSGGEDMRLETDGDLHVDGNVIAYSTTISDERLKTDIERIDGALDKVCALSGYTFTYKHDGKASAGVVAQEVEKVLPSAVIEKELAFQGGDQAYKIVQYDQLHGLLIEAIKEQQEQINELKAMLENK